MALDTEKIIEDLKGASILELNDLVKLSKKNSVFPLLLQLQLQVLLQALQKKRANLMLN